MKKTIYVNQHLQYLPFGEGYIDQRTDHDIRFKFTTKEEDGEPGYRYFGARYYDADLSVWLSVDPLSDMYPSTSPFMYVRGNPINLIDPNGLGDRPPNRHKRYKPKKKKYGDPAGNSPAMKLHKIGRKFKIGRRIGTIKVARYRTTDWTDVLRTSGNGQNGKSTYKHNVDDISSYLLRGVRVRNEGGGVQGAIVTTGKRVNRRFGAPIDGYMWMFNGGGSYIQGGFIPLLSQALLAAFPVSAPALIMNMSRINPFHRNQSDFAVYRGGLPNSNSSLQIKFRFRQKIGTSRSRISKWFHGIK